ncbi:MAG TPA: hypothetical protein VMK12_08830 [Anaeromyxobacteraceae bacterium]|nr:hypothetical protein [Anaeromyxobacteraceae bacterium]
MRVLLLLAVAAIVAIAGISHLLSRRDARESRRQRESLRRELLERTAVARGLGGSPGVEEAKAVLRWWFDESGILHKRFGSVEASSQPLEKEKGAGLEAYRRYAGEWLDMLRGEYAPALSASDQGLRLDVLGIRPGVHPESHERMLRIDFALWGAPRRIELEPAGGERSSLRVVVPLSFRQLAFRFLDAAGKTYGEMSGVGEPYMMIKDPERFSFELPPGMALGTWWVEPFPRETARVEISVGVQVQGMTSASLTPTFRWELPVSDEWKLRPGEVFHAETREAPSEPPPTQSR